MPNNFFITFNIFNDCAGLVCAFSTRRGGFSKGVYHSLNLYLNSGDSPRNVEKNRKILFDHLGIDRNSIATAGQIHSANIEWIAKPGFYAETDALLCREKGVFLSVQTADCFPLMIYIPDSKIVAAVHCGWRGVAAGIVKRVLAACNVSMHNALAVIGPGIQKTCYEVGADVYTRFDRQYLGLHKDPNKRYLDLQGKITDILLNSGFDRDRIYCEQTCTHCAEDIYYSYRRDGKKTGRMLAIIGLR
jgi:YfiH family protein